MTCTVIASPDSNPGLNRGQLNGILVFCHATEAGVLCTSCNMQAANTQATNLCSKLKIGNYKQPNEILLVQETVTFKTHLGEIPCRSRNLRGRILVRLRQISLAVGGLITAGLLHGRFAVCAFGCGTSSPHCYVFRRCHIVRTPGLWPAWHIPSSRGAEEWSSGFINQSMSGPITNINSGLDFRSMALELISYIGLRL